MRNIVKCLVFCAVVGFCISNMWSQQPAVVPPAPVPSQILHAKKIFVVNAEGDNDPRFTRYTGGPTAVYDRFYADLKDLGRFEMVSAPADADLVLQVTLAEFAVLSGYPRFRLAIIDPKTNILLWTISEPVDPAFLAKTASRNIAQSLARLTQDVSLLIPKE